MFKQRSAVLDILIDTVSMLFDQSDDLGVIVNCSNCLCDGLILTALFPNHYWLSCLNQGNANLNIWGNEAG